MIYLSSQQNWLLRARVVISNCPASGSLIPSELSLSPPPPHHGLWAQDKVLPPSLTSFPPSVFPSLLPRAWPGLGCSQNPRISLFLYINSKASHYLCLQLRWKCPNITSRMITFLLTCFPPLCISTNVFWKTHFKKCFPAVIPLPGIFLLPSLQLFCLLVWFGYYYSAIIAPS